MEKQYKLTDRVSKDSLKSPTFKKWLKRVLCLVCILSLALQLTLCCIPMQVSAEQNNSVVGTWVFNEVLTHSDVTTTYDIDFSMYVYGDVIIDNGTSITINKVSQSSKIVVILRSNNSNYPYYLNRYVAGSGWIRYYHPYAGASNNSAFSNDIDIRSITITGGDDVNNSSLKTWLDDNAVKVVETVYDFTGEYRLFNEQLTNLSFAQSGTVTQTYRFDYQIWNGYSADYFSVQASGSQVDISYAFIDEGSGGVTTVYRQLLRNGQKVGTWLVPRARLIYFESNPDDPTFQQWLLDNTVLVDESMLQTVYDFGYNNGFNDGWTDNLIGDTLNAPIQALNNITLLQVGNTVITLGGVIFTMIVLCILIVFLKKFAGG